MTGHVLIVDDDQSMAETLTKAMTRRGFVVTWKTSAADALTLLDDQDFDVVVTDLHMEGMNGFAFCERVTANRPDVPVVMITAFGSLDSAVSAIRVGAYDFITKPFDVEALRLTLSRAIQHRRLRDEVKRLRQVVSDTRGLDQMIGASAPIQKALFGGIGTYAQPQPHGQDASLAQQRKIRRHIAHPEVAVRGARVEHGEFHLQVLDAGQNLLITELRRAA